MSSIAKTSSARLEETDILRLRHLIGAVLMPVSLWTHLLIPGASSVVAGISIVLMFAGLVAPGLFARGGVKFWHRVGVVTVIVAVADLVFTGLTDRTQLVSAVLRSAMLIATVRTLQPRARREDMQLALLALFLCAVGGALTLSPVFAVQALVFVPAAGALMFLLDRAEGSAGARLSREDWKSFRWRTFFSRLAAAGGKGGALFLGGCLAFTLVSGALIFALLPRFNIESTLPFLRSQGTGRTGFSDNVKFGDIGDILQDETPALRADTPGNRRPLAQIYWRMVALDRYADGGFSLSAPANESFRGYTSSEVPMRGSVSASPGSPGLRGEWTVFAEGNVSRYLPLPGIPLRLRFNQARRWESSDALLSLRLREQPGDGVPMQVSIGADSEYFRPTKIESELFAVAGTPVKNSVFPGTELALPPDDATRKALSAAVLPLAPVAGDATVFAKNAVAWLRSRHANALSDSYGRKTPNAGEPPDYLVRWMASGGTGWCEHFAGSFVLLARAAGYPARLVTGFVGGEWNETSNYLLVRMKNGHAWAEIYDRDTALWRRVDPTPPGRGLSADAAADTSHLAGMSRMGAIYDGATMWWFRRVVNFDEADQRAASDSLVSTFKAMREDLAASLRRMKENVAAFLSRYRETPKKLILPACLVVAVLALTVPAKILLRKRRAGRLKTAGDDDPAIRRYRAEAGRLLVALTRARVPESEIAAVRFIRFGRPSAWPEPESVFTGARNALKKARRDSRM